MTATPTSETPTHAESLESSSAPLTAGKLLRAARLKAGVHLAVLSVTLKVPVKQLEALESDQLDPAKGPVFFRGLTSAVCRHLHTDPAPILALLPLAPGQLAPQKTVDEVSLVAQGMGAMRWTPSKSRKPVFWGATAMLVLIAALLWLPAPTHWIWLDDLSSWFESQSQSAEASPQDAGPPVMAAPTGLDSPDAKIVAETVALPMAVTMVPTSTQTPTPEPAPVTAPAAASGPIPAPLSQAFPSTAPKTDSAEWVFSATLDSWIELRHGQNTVVWSGLVKAGQSQRVQSPLPVSVVVGRAQGVTVTLRGKAFDLKPHTQVTVARFEVKE